jgi:hypothetical protein
MVLGFAASEARSCPFCTPPPMPWDLHRPYPDDPTPVVLERERLELVCNAEANAPVCQLVGHYTLRNPTSEVQALRLTYSYALGSLRAASYERQPLPLRIAPRPLRGGLSGWWREQSLRPLLAQFEVVLAPGATGELVIEGRVALWRWTAFHHDAVPLRARHPFLDAGDGTVTLHLVQLMTSEAYPYDGVGRFEAEVDAPASWIIEGGSWFASDRYVSWSHRPARSGRQRVFIDGRSGGRSSAVTLRIQGTGPPLAARDRFRFGGPFVAVGADATSPAEVRVRIGVESSYPRWALYSVAVDADARERIAVAPSFELATLTRPVSLAVGAGIPVRETSRLAVGGRLQASIQIPWVGLVASADMFPGEVGKKEADPTDLVVVARVSL